MNGKYFKEFVGYCGLNVLGMVGISCYILADTFFISKGMGTDGLAALNICIPAYSVMYGLGLMLGVGGATGFALSRERGDKDAGKKYFTNTIIVGATVSAVFFFCGAFAPRQVVVLLGAQNEIIGMSETYLRVLWMFSPAFILNAVVLSFLRNDGAPALATAGMVVGSAANIFLDWLFIFPLDMGIFGAILATGLSPVISLCVYLPHYIRRKNGFGLGRTKVEPKLWLKSAVIGFPSFVAEASTAAVIFSFNKIMLSVEGTVGVAAYGVIANIVVVILAIYNGIANGIQPSVSRTYAVGNEKGAGKFLTYAVVSCVCVGCAVYACAYFGADDIAAIFNSEGDVRLQELAVEGIKLYFIGAIFVGVNIVASAYFAAKEKPVQAHALSLARGLVIILPSAFILSEKLGAYGLWISFPITEGIVLAISITLLAVDLFAKKKGTNGEKKEKSF